MSGNGISQPAHSWRFLLPTSRREFPQITAGKREEEMMQEIMPQLMNVVLEHRLEPATGKETRCRCGCTFIREEVWARHVAEQLYPIAKEMSEK
jgi:hypothetical protein